MKTVFIVKGLGFGDDEDTYEPLCVFDTQSEAEAHVAALRENDAAEGIDNTYEVEPVEFG